MSVDLPVLKKIGVDGGQAFTELGELVVESGAVGGK